jgi:hypothetical protein
MQGSWPGSTGSSPIAAARPISETGRRPVRFLSGAEVSGAAAGARVREAWSDCEGVTPAAVAKRISERADDDYEDRKRNRRPRVPRSRRGHRDPRLTAYEMFASSLVGKRSSRTKGGVKIRE